MLSAIKFVQEGNWTDSMQLSVGLIRVKHSPVSNLQDTLRSTPGQSRQSIRGATFGRVGSPAGSRFAGENP